MDWIREHFSLLMLIGVVGLMLIGALSIHFPGGSGQTSDCPAGATDCPPAENI